MISKDIIVLAALVLILAAMAALAMVSVIQGHERQKKFASRISDVVTPSAARQIPPRRSCLSRALSRAPSRSREKPRISSVSIWASRRPTRSNGGWCHLWLWH